MVKEFRKAQTILLIDDEGYVTYMVDNKKTTFDLKSCESFTYYYNDNAKIVIDTVAIAEASRKQIKDNYLWLLILKGEELLECNNEHTETRRHESYNNKNDKWEVFKDEGIDIEAAMIKQANIEELNRAIDLLLPQQKELINKVYFQQIPITEIARLDGVDKSAISHRLKKAYLRIQKYLENN